MYMYIYIYVYVYRLEEHMRCPAHRAAKEPAGKQPGKEREGSRESKCGVVVLRRSSGL